MPTGDEFAFGTIRANVEFYLGDLFFFKGQFQNTILFEKSNIFSHVKYMS